MDKFITDYTALVTSAQTGLQKLGLVSIPLVLAVLAFTALFGGERALRAVGAGIAVAAILLLLLNNAAGIGKWMAAPTTPPVPAGMILGLFGLA